VLVSRVARVSARWVRCMRGLGAEQRQTTHKDFVKVLVGLLSGLEDAPGVVDSTRVSLKTEENFPSGRRAVDEGRSKGIEAGQVVGVDVAEEAGQRRSCMAVVPKVVNPDVRKLGYAAVKGGHGGRRTPTPTGEARLG
jgi:hypothetical protein